MQGEGVAGRIQADGEGVLLIPHPKETIHGEQNCARPKQSPPGATPIGGAPSIVSLRSRCRIHSGQLLSTKLSITVGV